MYSYIVGLNVAYAEIKRACGICETWIGALGEKWDGTHFARLTAAICKLCETNSPMGGQFLSEIAPTHDLRNTDFYSR